jgi:hypothetical protein
MRTAMRTLLCLVNALALVLLCTAAHADSTCNLLTARPADKLYQLHSDKRIFVRNDRPCTSAQCFGGWFLLDQNPNTVSIAAFCELYQIHSDGAIFHYTGRGIALDECKTTPCLHWEQLDQNAQTKTIAVGIKGDAPILYQLHKDGMIFRKNGNPCREPACFDGWDLLDKNPRTKAIVAGTTFFYQLHDDGTIFVHDGTSACVLQTDFCTGWALIAQDPNTVEITAGGKLYRIHRDRTIFRYTGSNEPCSTAPCPNWERLGQDPSTMMIKAGAHTLYRLTTDGRILQHNGRACQTGVCSEAWDQLVQNPNIVAIAAGESVYRLQAGDPGVFQFHEDACGHDAQGIVILTCDDAWERSDANAGTTGIVVNGALFSR